MQYRTLGRSGLRVSEIGMGCEGFLEKTDAQVREMVDLMEAEGVNCIDLYAPNPQMRSSLGRALQGRREKFVLQAHLCAVWEDGQYKRTREIEAVRGSFADQLERLKTDHVEIGMIHYVDSVADWDAVAGGEVMAYALALKAQGSIGCIGVSSHNPEAALRAVASGKIDVLMFSINPCYDLLPGTENVEDLWAEQSYARPLLNMDPKRAELYETCQRLGVGITVMKAFGGGDLLSRYSPAGRALTAYQCIHYALTRPAVASIMCGARNYNELKNCIDYASAPEADRDYAGALAALPKISWKGHCMYCGHCAPCPQGIDVAAVTKFYNLARAQGTVPETVREHYAVLRATAGDCVQCGACEARCPFEVRIRENMRHAAELFGR